MSKMFLSLLACMTLLAISPMSSAKTKSRSVQEVSFGDMDIKGTARNPDGAYLVQKKGVKFLPLHEVQRSYDVRIRESSLLMR